MSLAANIAAANLRRFGNWWLSKPRIQATAHDYLQRLRIAAPSVDTPIVNLSGGNQQKALIGAGFCLSQRCCLSTSRLAASMLASKVRYIRCLRELANRGTAIVVISSDLPEVLAVADRVLVMRKGGLPAGLRVPKQAKTRSFG